MHKYWRWSTAITARVYVSCGLGAVISSDCAQLVPAMCVHARLQIKGLIICQYRRVAQNMRELVQPAPMQQQMPHASTMHGVHQHHVLKALAIADSSLHGIQHLVEAHCVPRLHRSCPALTASCGQLLPCYSGEDTSSTCNADGRLR